MNILQEIIYGVICFLAGVILGVYAPDANAREYCMDKHGSAYSAERCDDRDITPEYMYTDRETQRLQMILNQYSAQALMGIAANGATRITSVDNSSLNNSQGQTASNSSQNALHSTNRNDSYTSSGSIANSSSRANSAAIANNSNTNDNDNTNFNGVWK